MNKETLPPVNPEENGENNNTFSIGDFDLLSKTNTKIPQKTESKVQDPKIFPEPDGFDDSFFLDCLGSSSKCVKKGLEISKPFNVDLKARVQYTPIYRYIRTKLKTR